METQREIQNEIWTIDIDCLSFFTALCKAVPSLVIAADEEDDDDGAPSMFAAVR